MEVGNILRNFCLESTTISEAARKRELREREGTWSREGKRERENGRAVSQWGAWQCLLCTVSFCAFLCTFLFNYSLPLSHAPPEGEEKRRGWVRRNLAPLICCQARRGSLENCAAHLKCGCLFCCRLRARQSF